MSTADQYTILPATATDAKSMRAVSKRANAPNLLHQAFYPKHLAHLTPQEELDEWQLNTVIQRLDEGEAIYHKAVLTKDPDRLVGFSGWFPPGALSKSSDSKTTQAGGETDDENRTPKRPPHFNPAARDNAVRDEYSTQLKLWQEKIWGESEDYWYVCAMIVDPAFERKGIARRLLAEGLKLVDQSHKPVYLESTPQGRGFYERLGFEVKGEFGMCGGEHVVTLFVRDAL